VDAQREPRSPGFDGTKVKTLLQGNRDEERAIPFDSVGDAADWRSLGSDVKAAGAYFRGYVPHGRTAGSIPRPRKLTELRFASMVRELFPEPIVRVQGSHYVDVQVMRNHWKVLVNLLNAGGPHDYHRTLVFDEIPPVGHSRSASVVRINLNG